MTTMAVDPIVRCVCCSAQITLNAALNEVSATAPLGEPMNSYACWIRGLKEWTMIVEAESAGKARYKYWLKVHDVYRRIAYTEARSRLA
jgi:hypothetical protein